MLAGKDLVEAAGTIFTNVNWDNFSGWHFDLNLGKEAYITSQRYPCEIKDYLTIRPGEFALLTSEETIELPDDTMGFISVKLVYKKCGLINVSGFHVDPCFKGNLIFSVYNAGPSDILLKKGTPVFMIFFCKLTQGLGRFSDTYPNKNDDYSEKIQTKVKRAIERKNHELIGIPLEMVSGIKGASVSLANNNARMDKLEASIKIYGAIVLSIIGGLLLLILQNWASR